MRFRQPGEYRIEVDPDRDSTTIFVRSGGGEAYGDGAAYVIDARQPYRFTGTDLREYQPVGAPPLDEFDRWSRDRDRAFDTSVSARYVSPDVVGYQDLDANGTWRADATYGNVWFPSRVSVGWAPYRDGHWAWIDPWGWTWVDDAPWGFAVSHYGRWANLGGAWGWVPGPVRTPAYYAPALVVFVGGANFQLTISSGNVGGVAWFPLGPREVYRPSYPVSRGYFENVNRSNTVINNTVINNTYNTTNVTNIVYANRRVPGAVVAVPTTAFVQSQPVSRAAVRIDQDTIANRPGEAAPAVAPTQNSVRGAAAERDKPPARVFDRPVLARTAPPTPHAGFAAQQPQLTARPGKPLDDAARKELKPATAAPAPAVMVVAPAREAPRALRAPPPAPTKQPPEQRGSPEQRGQSQQPGASGQRRTPEQRAQPVPPAPAASQGGPVARPPAQREQPVQREQSRQREPGQREQPKPAPAAKQAEPRPPSAVAKPAPPEPAPRSASRARAPMPAASQPDDKRGEPDKAERDKQERDKQERDKQERDTENRKPRN